MPFGLPPASGVELAGQGISAPFIDPISHLSSAFGDGG
jgi:hypothetical protein